MQSAELPGLTPDWCLSYLGIAADAADSATADPLVDEAMTSQNASEVRPRRSAKKKPDARSGIAKTARSAASGASAKSGTSAAKTSKTGRKVRSRRPKK
jgi:hypothetical protein